MTPDKRPHPEWFCRLQTTVGLPPGLNLQAAERNRKTAPTWGVSGIGLHTQITYLIRGVSARIAAVWYTCLQNILQKPAGCRLQHWEHGARCVNRRGGSP